jgi:hypothetical protein
MARSPRARVQCRLLLKYQHPSLPQIAGLNHAQHIVVIQGHPDPNEGHFCHALASAYAQGAQVGKHEVRRITIANIDFPILRTKDDWESAPPPETIRHAQDVDPVGTASRGGLSAVARWHAGAALFGAHSLRSFERNILRFIGIKPVRESLIGMVEERRAAGRNGSRMRMCGERGD